MKRPIWSLAFRPFFLFGAAHALLAILLWVAYMNGLVPLPSRMDPFLWHPHEMIYGFTAAILVGFVLTAAQNWTGIPGVKGRPLQLLFGLWLAARILFVLPFAPPALVALVDLAFFPAAAVTLWPYLKDPELKTERVFYLFFGLLFVGNALVHLDALGIFTGHGRQGLYLGLNAILLVIIFMGGRVIPFFTESSVARAQPRVHPPLEIASHASAALFLVASVFLPSSPLVGAIAFLTAGIHLARLAGWYVRRIRRIPLVWVLHAGYLWLVAGFFLTGLAQFGWLAASPATHAFTLGGLAVVVYGMISRVSLGHTGRRLHPSAWTVAGYVLLNLAGVVRVFGPVAFPAHYLATLAVSGWLWAGAFAIFVVVYAPMLTRPRADGRPG